MRTQVIHQSVIEAGKRLAGRLQDLIDLFGLDEIQTDSLRAVAANLQNGQNRQFVNIYGGGGKTRVGLAIIEGLSEPDGTLPQTIYKAPTRVTLQRFITEAEKVGSRIHSENLFGEYHAFAKDASPRVVLTTNRSHILGHAREVFTPANTNLIISDEGHHQLAPGQIQLNNSYASTIHIALTASPEYSAEKTLANEFHAAFERSVQEGIDAKRIVDFDNYMFMLGNVDIGSVKKQAGDFNAKDIARLTDEKEVYLETARMIESWIDPHSGAPIMGRKIIMFVGTIQQAENANAFFNRYFKNRLKKYPDLKGVKSFSFTDHSANTFETNSDADEAFRAGRHLMMITVRTKAEGYDNEQISVGINIVPTTSKRLAVQRGLRTMRRNPADPDKRALNIDIMYRDTSKRSLSFSEAVGRATSFILADAADPLADAFESYWQLQTARVFDNSVTGPRMIAPDKLIREHAAHKRTSKNIVDFMQEIIPEDSKLRTHPRNIKGDRILLEVRAKMMERGYLSIREIYNEARIENPDLKIDYHKMLWICLASSNQYLKTEENFFEVNKNEIKILQSKLDLDREIVDFFTEQDLKKQRIRVFVSEVFNESRHTIRSGFLLPKLDAKLNELGIDKFEDLFSLVQWEYPFRKLDKQVFEGLIHGGVPAVAGHGGASASKPHRNIRHEALALARFLQTDPRELFSEDQYFELRNKFRERFSHLRIEVTESFGTAPRLFTDDKYIHDGRYKNSGVMISVAEVKWYNDGMNMVHVHPELRSIISNNTKIDCSLTEPEIPPRWMRPVTLIDGSPVETQKGIDYLADDQDALKKITADKGGIHCLDTMDSRMRDSLTWHRLATIRQLFNAAAAPSLSYPRMLAAAYRPPLSDEAVKSFIENGDGERHFLEDRLDVDLTDLRRNYSPKHNFNKEKVEFERFKEIEQNFALEELLPNIRTCMTKLGLQNFTDLFRMAQLEYPFKSLSTNRMWDIMTGYAPPVGAKGIASMNLITHEALALCRLFQTHPYKLFDEKQYFKLTEDAGDNSQSGMDVGRKIIMAQGRTIHAIEMAGIAPDKSQLIVEKPQRIPRWAVYKGQTMHSAELR